VGAARAHDRIFILEENLVKNAMSENSKKCDIRIVPKGTDDWTLELSGDCGETQKLIENLPPRRSRYLERRTRKVD
jgi:hypothetical protein